MSIRYRIANGTMPRQIVQKPDLTRENWIVAALQALVEGGVEAVRVEPLAARLGVTKGSFYWHFKDRPALLDALLGFWESEFTGQLILGAVELATPQARLRALAREALAVTVHGVDNARAEMAMQAWAARDAKVARRLGEIDLTRIRYLTDELEGLGFNHTRAVTLAKALYQAVLGLYAARAYNPDIASDEAFLALVELVLAETRWNR